MLAVIVSEALFHPLVVCCNGLTGVHTINHQLWSIIIPKPLETKLKVSISLSKEPSQSAFEDLSQPYI